MHPVSLRYLFVRFIQLGAVSFGGYLALVAMVHSRFVERDRKVPGQFLADLVALASFLPGPVAVNTVSAVGYYLRGWMGMITAFTAILTPAFLTMYLLFSFHEQVSEAKLFQAFVRGAAAVVTAVIFSVGLTMVKKEPRSGLLLMLPLVITALIWVQGYAALLIILVSAGTVGWYFNRTKYPRSHQKLSVGIALPLLIFAALGVYILPVEGLVGDLVSTFLSVSLSLFGGGYVMVPFLQEIVVTQKHWLSETEFVNAITFGQITPGPILISAAFVGFKQAGFLGGLVATLAIFLPSSLLMTVLSSHFQKHMDDRHVKAFFDGLRIAIIGLILYSASQFFKMQTFNWITVAVASVTLLLISRYRINAVYLVAAGGLIGIFSYLVGILT